MKKDVSKINNMNSMRNIKLFLYVFITICIAIASYDVLSGFKIRTNLVNQFCGGTVGDCHYQVENVYGIFHNIGTLFSFFFSGSTLAFIFGQLLTLIFFLFGIWIVFYFFKKLVKMK